MSVLQVSGAQTHRTPLWAGFGGMVYAYKQAVEAGLLLAEPTWLQLMQGAVYAYKQLPALARLCGSVDVPQRPTVYTYKQPWRLRQHDASPDAAATAAPGRKNTRAWRVAVHAHGFQHPAAAPWHCRMNPEIHAYRQHGQIPNRLLGPDPAAKAGKPAGHADARRRVYAYKPSQSWEPDFSDISGFCGTGASTTATVSSRSSSAVANARRLSSGTAIETSKTSPRCL